MILKEVKDTIRRYGLIEKNDLVLIGVSGGPDSLALLYLLNSLNKELKIKLHIAHLDHMLRKDSHKDRVFVENLAKKLKIPINCAQVNVKKLASPGSPEEIARNARLGFLFRVAGEIKADKIALGHNQDDQAETVLMRILRGTGLYGLSAISPKRDIAGHCIIRPLIEIKRSQIQIFLQAKGIKPRMDASNLEDIYLRNKLRNRLIPLLEREYNKNIKGVLANMAKSAACDYDYLNAVALRIKNGIKNKIDLNRLLKLHPAIRRLVIRRAIGETKGNIRRITFQHIKEIEDLILNRPINSVVDLPQGISLVKKKKHLSFYKR